MFSKFIIFIVVTGSGNETLHPGNEMLGSVNSPIGNWKLNQCVARFSPQSPLYSFIISMALLV